jgi:hypothetical protein
VTQDEIIDMARQVGFNLSGELILDDAGRTTITNRMVGFAKLVAAKAIAELESQEPVAHPVIAGALFDFMGWLTSRKERIVLSSSDEASPAVDAIRDFAKMRGLSLDDAKVQNWHTNPPQHTEQNFCPRCGKRTNDIHTCTPPQRSESSGKPSAWVGLTDEEIEDIVEDCDGVGWDVAQAIRAKLKEKNT